MSGLLLLETRDSFWLHPFSVDAFQLTYGAVCSAWGRTSQWMASSGCWLAQVQGTAQTKLFARVPRARCGLRLPENSAPSYVGRSERRRLRGCTRLDSRRAHIMWCGCSYRSRQRASSTTTLEFASGIAKKSECAVNNTLQSLMDRTSVTATLAQATLLGPLSDIGVRLTSSCTDATSWPE